MNQQEPLSLPKERSDYIDNIKGILIFLVVLGHVIEDYANENYFLYMLWMYIYCFHMPVFIYISGYLSKDAKKTQDKAFQRFLLPYLVWNSFYYIFTSIYHRKFEFSFLFPMITNWYLLSLFTMCLLLPVVIKLRWSVFVVFFMSLISGFFFEFSALFAFSRTVCFFGFFLLGYYSDAKTLEKIKNNKKLIAVAGIIVMAIIAVCCRSEIMEKNLLMEMFKKKMSYQLGGFNFINGFISRAVTIPVSIIMGVFVLAFIPQKRNIFTVIGRHSVIILIFHEYFVLAFDKIVKKLFINMETITGTVLLMAFSIGVTLFLSINVFHKIYDKIMGSVQKILIKDN